MLDSEVEEAKQYVAVKNEAKKTDKKSAKKNIAESMLANELDMK